MKQLKLSIKQSKISKIIFLKCFAATLMSSRADLNNAVHGTYHSVNRYVKRIEYRLAKHTDSLSWKNKSQEENGANITTKGYKTLDRMIKAQGAY